MQTSDLSAAREHRPPDLKQEQRTATYTPFDFSAFFDHRKAISLLLFLFCKRHRVPFFAKRPSRSSSESTAATPATPAQTYHASAPRTQAIGAGGLATADGTLSCASTLRCTRSAPRSGRVRPRSHETTSRLYWVERAEESPGGRPHTPQGAWRNKIKDTPIRDACARATAVNPDRAWQSRRRRVWAE